MNALPPLLIAAQRIGGHIRAGAHHARRAGAGYDFWQYRQAEAHEPAQRIDWKISGRSTRLWVRDNEAESPQHLALWCDLTASMHWRSQPALPRKIERARLCACALAEAALRGGERIKPLNAAPQGHSLSGPHALARLAGSLFGQSTQALPPGSAGNSYEPLLIISDFLVDKDHLEHVLSRLAARSIRAHLLCILDPAELSLPYDGPIRLEGCEDDGHVMLTAHTALRDSYQQSMNDHIDQLTALTRKNDASFTLHLTSEPAPPALLTVHAHLRRTQRCRTS